MKYLSLLLFSLSLLQADVAAHFKSAPNKSEGHLMRNIDFIYMINLDQRPEKFARCIEQLSLYGITPYRFSAVNGWELSLEAIEDVGVRFQPWMSSGRWGTYHAETEHLHEIVQQVGRPYFCHCMSRGAIGISLSHLSILQDAYDSGYETIWIMEDDIDVMRDPQCLPDLIDRLDALVGKEEWDVLFTDQDTKSTQGTYVPCTSFAWRPNYSPANQDRFAERTDLGGDFRRVGARFGAYSMIVRRSGMRKILDFIREFNIFLPYDMDFTQPNDIHLYTVTTDIVSTQPTAVSDNGLPTYLRQ